MSAMGTFTEGEPEELTGESWISGTLGVATVSASGLVTPVAEGTTTITVTKGDIDATAEITVTAAELISVALQQGYAATMETLPFQMVAMGTFTDGSEHVITGGDWIASKPNIAMVSQDGVATGVQAGESLIFYKHIGVDPAVAEFEVFPGIVTVEWDETTMVRLKNLTPQVRQIVTYELKDAMGNIIEKNCRSNSVNDSGSCEWPGGTRFNLRASSYYEHTRQLIISRSSPLAVVVEDRPHDFNEIYASGPINVDDFFAILEVKIPSGVRGHYVSYEIVTQPTVVHAGGEDG
jgi:hypothetical protein